MRNAKIPYFTGENEKLKVQSAVAHPGGDNISMNQFVLIFLYVSRNFEQEASRRQTQKKTNSRWSSSSVLFCISSKSSYLNRWFYMNIWRAQGDSWRWITRYMRFRKQSVTTAQGLGNGLLELYFSERWCVASSNKDAGIQDASASQSRREESKREKGERERGMMRI